MNVKKNLERPRSKIVIPKHEQDQPSPVAPVSSDVSRFAVRWYNACVREFKNELCREGKFEENLAEPQIRSFYRIPPRPPVVKLEVTENKLEMTNSQMIEEAYEARNACCIEEEEPQKPAHVHVYGNVAGRTSEVGHHDGISRKEKKKRKKMLEIVKNAFNFEEEDVDNWEMPKFKSKIVIPPRPPQEKIEAKEEMVKEAEEHRFEEEIVEGNSCYLVEVTPGKKAILVQDLNNKNRENAFQRKARMQELLKEKEMILNGKVEFDFQNFSNRNVIENERILKFLSKEQIERIRLIKA